MSRTRELYIEHHGILGGPWMQEELRYGGNCSSWHRVGRLMRRAGLQDVPQRQRWRQKTSGLPPAWTQNHLERDFTATAPNTT